MATVYNRTEATLYLDLDLQIEEVASGDNVQIDMENFYAITFEGYGTDFFLVHIPPPGGAVSSNPAVLSADGQPDIYMHNVIEDGVVSIIYDYEEENGDGMVMEEDLEGDVQEEGLDEGEVGLDEEGEGDD